MKEGHEAEAHRLAEMLAILVRRSGRSHRSLEQELGLGSAFLSKILRGKVRLQLAHVLGICDALGVPPGQFFQTAFPVKAAPPVRPIAELRAALELPPEGEDALDLEEKVKRILRKVLLEEKL